MQYIAYTAYWVHTEDIPSPSAYYSKLTTFKSDESGSEILSFLVFLIHVRLTWLLEPCHKRAGINGKIMLVLSWNYIPSSIILGVM